MNRNKAHELIPLLFTAYHKQPTLKAVWDDVTDKLQNALNTVEWGLNAECGELWQHITELRQLEGEE